MAYKMKGFPKHKGISPVKRMKPEDTEELRPEPTSFGDAMKNTNKKAGKGRDWGKRTGDKIKEEAIGIGREALTGALTNALKPKEKKTVNPTAGFNVKFGG